MNFGLIIELAKRDFTREIFWFGARFCLVIHLSSHQYTDISWSSSAVLWEPDYRGMSSVWGYGVYLIAGLVPWTAFVNTVSRASTVFLDKKNIIAKIHVDLPTLPLYIVLSESITFVVTYVIFMIILTLTGFAFTIYLMLIPVLYLVQQVFAYALGFFLAMIVVFLRDLKEVVSIGLQIWFWFTPIVYTFDILPQFAQQILIWNPMLSLISAYHDLFVYQRMPSFFYITFVLIV